MKEKYYIYFSIKELIVASFVALALVTGTFISISEGTEAVADRISCSSFSSFEQAQRSYRKGLDKDGDGLACETYKY